LYREKWKVTVAPLKLCAVLLLARLVSRVIPNIQLDVSIKYFCSDSNTVLAWIASQSTWRIFVAHRVGEIQEKTSEADWDHVDTKDNPPDEHWRYETKIPTRHRPTPIHSMNRTKTAIQLTSSIILVSKARSDTTTVITDQHARSK